jgi:hypothetical protein
VLVPPHPPELRSGELRLPLQEDEELDHRPTARGRR